MSFDKKQKFLPLITEIEWLISGGKESLCFKVFKRKAFNTNFSGLWDVKCRLPGEAGNRHDASLVFQYLTKYSNTAFLCQRGIALEVKVSANQVL